MTHRGQQHKLLQLVFAQCRQQSGLARRDLTDKPQCHTISRTSSRWPHRRHTFSTSPRQHQETPIQQPWPTYFQSPSPPPPPPPPPKAKRHIIRHILFIISFVTLGEYLGDWVEKMVNPPPPLLAGSEDDIKQKTSLYQALDHNLKLAELNEPDRYIFWDPYSVLPPEQRKHHLVASSLSSSSALGGYQRIFQDKTTGDVYSLLHFGPAVTGWPRLVHGGALATALDETCGRVAFARLGRGESGKDRPIVTAKLKVDYLKMTRADRAYIVGARVMRDDELEPEERGKGHYKAHIEAWVKDPETNEKNVVARALYIGPKPKKGEAVEAGDGTPKIVPPERRF